MSDQHSITNVDDGRLVAFIGAATRRVLYLAPGASDEVAKALCEAWGRLGPTAVHVILDVDPEVCRLGYGTLEGLKALREAAAQARTLVCHQPGVRIGLLIADDTTLIYSPTPLLIEAGSTQPEHPNAIQLQAPPAEVERDVGLGENPDRDRTVGLEPVKESQVTAAENDLAGAPPVKFDLARRVRVFTSRFQFVELELTGCYISRKKVPIPSTLVGLARNRDVASQFHAHFNLVSKAKLEVTTPEGGAVSERSLRGKRQDIIRAFLIPLKGYGSVVLRANKDRLVEAIGELEADVKVFQEGVTKELQKLMDDNAGALIDALFPAVKRNPPDAYTKFHGPAVGEGYLRDRLEKDIRDAFGQAEDLVDEMKVALVFKDIAYESLVDEEFLKVAREAMPGVKFLHKEYDAAQPDDDEDDGVGAPT